MSNNGRSPTAETIDGITIDANHISRRKFVLLTNEINKAILDDDAILRDELSGELVELIVKAWPFDKPITKDTYLDLGLMDSQRVDEAIGQFMKSISEKKQAASSTSLENIASLSEK